MNVKVFAACVLFRQGFNRGFPVEKTFDSLILDFFLTKLLPMPRIERDFPQWKSGIFVEAASAAKQG